MRSVITIDELNASLAPWRQEGQPIGFVPTMGALHQGHMSLVTAAKAQCRRVVVSVFVNPTQFGPSEDFGKYPRTLKEDLALASEAGADVVFCPLATEIYPAGFGTFVHNPTAMAHVLCGASRPGHFQGVLTVVLRLLQLVRPHAAFFGRKDYQQFKLIERMVRDLAIPVAVHGCPIVRERDGLAMSSRNRYLDPGERATAARIHEGLVKVAQAVSGGQELDGAAASEIFRAHAALCPDLAVEYAELRRAEDLAAPEGFLTAGTPYVMAVACRVGATRLIDNVEMGR